MGIDLREATEGPQFSHTEEEIIASYSSFALHRKCPQAWMYRHELHLRRPITGPAPELRFGSWWGAVKSADALERGRKHDSLVVPPRTFTPIDGGPTFNQEVLTVRDVFEAANDWWKNQDPLSVEVWMEKIGEPLPIRLLKVYKSWRDRWADETQYERPLGVEVFWKRPLPRPGGDERWETSSDWIRMQDVTIFVLGYIDQIYFDTRRGLVVVRDDKTGKDLGSRSALDDMFDSQLQLYPWGVTPYLESLGVEAPKAVAYDRVKSSKPASPRLTATGGLSTVSKNYDLGTYMEWAQTDTRPSPEELEKIIEEKGFTDEGNPLAEMIRNLPPGRVWGKVGDFFVSGAKKGEPKFGVYQVDQGVVDRITTPSHMSMFQQRTLVPVSRHLVRSHLRAAVDTANDLWRTRQRVEIAHETARNLSKGNCQWCDYQSLCYGQMIGGPDGDYDLREFGLVVNKRPEKNYLSGGKTVETIPMGDDAA